MDGCQGEKKKRPDDNVQVSLTLPFSKTEGAADLGGKFMTYV